MTPNLIGQGDTWPYNVKHYSPPQRVPWYFPVLAWIILPPMTIYVLISNLPIFESKNGKIR